MAASKRKITYSYSLQEKHVKTYKQMKMWDRELKEENILEKDEFIYSWELLYFQFIHSSKYTSPEFDIYINKKKYSLKLLLNIHEEQEYFTVQVCLDSVTEIIKSFIFIAISLFAKNGKESINYKILSKKLTFNRNECVFKNFIRKDFLNDKVDSYLSNNVITLNCEIYFENDKDSSTELVAINSPLKIKKLYDFKQFFEDKKFSDVKLIIDGKELNAHKCILSACSNVFAAMFEHNMKEQRENIVEITDFNYEVMREVLRFIYAGKVNNIETLTMDYLDAANKYEIDGLKTACEDVLINSLNIDNAIEMLTVVDRYNTEKLKKYVFELLNIIIKDVINTEAFQIVFKSLSAKTLREMFEDYVIKHL